MYDSRGCVYVPICVCVVVGGVIWCVHVCVCVCGGKGCADVLVCVYVVCVWWWGCSMVCVCACVHVCVIVFLGIDHSVMMDPVMFLNISSGGSPTILMRYSRF